MDSPLKNEVLSIKALETQFGVVYKQYQESLDNYNNALKKWTSGQKNYMQLKSMGWRGGVTTSTNEVNNVNECVAMCSSEPCPYAVYSNDDKTCTILGQNFIPDKGNKNQTGIIPDVLFYALTVDHYNMILIQLSEEIMNEYEKIKPKYEDQIVEKNQKKEILKGTWNNLVNQREKIQELIQQHNSLDASNKEQTLFVNQQNGTFKVWLFLAIILILLFLKQFADIDLSTNAIIIAVAAIMFIALSFNLSTSVGFFVWLMALLLVIMIYPMFTQG
jgi:hypothetical protein